MSTKYVISVLCGTATPIRPSSTLFTLIVNRYLGSGFSQYPTWGGRLFSWYTSYCGSALSRFKIIKKNASAFGDLIKWLMNWWGNISFTIKMFLMKHSKLYITNQKPCHQWAVRNLVDNFSEVLIILNVEQKLLCLIQDLKGWVEESSMWSHVFSM